MSFNAVHPAYDIYAQELWSLGHGHAMWGPEPSPAFGEIRLGDVGYLREGHFSFLFNCMSDAHDPVNKRGVPAGFEAFTPPDANSIQYRLDTITQNELHSKSIRSLALSVGASVSEVATSATAAATLRYQCMHTSGALLLLKENANKWFLDCDRHIKTYMASHIEQWHEFATMRLGIDLKQEDIIFVSGCTKTPVWAETAFHGTSSQGELVVSGGWPVLAVSGEFRVSLSRSADASVFSRIGPSHRVKIDKDQERVFSDTGSDAAPADQCIFLNYHKAKQRKRWRPLKVMKAAAGPQDPDHDFSGDDDGAFASAGPSSPAASEDSATTSSTMSEPGTSYNSFSPTDSLIEYIFANSDAETACVSDTDLTCIFPCEELPKDLLLTLEILEVPILMGNDYADVDTQYIPKNDVGTAILDNQPFDYESEFQSLIGRLLQGHRDNADNSMHSNSSPYSSVASDETLIDTQPSWEALVNFMSDNTHAPLGQDVSTKPVTDHDCFPPDLFEPPAYDSVPMARRYCPVGPGSGTAFLIDGLDGMAFEDAKPPFSCAEGSEDEDAKANPDDVKPHSYNVGDIEQQRRLNTLASRGSRKRKLENLEATVQREKEEKEMWMQRAMHFDALLEKLRQPEHEQELEAAVQREKAEKEMWRQRAMQSKIVLQSYELDHEMPSFEPAQS